MNVTVKKGSPVEDYCHSGTDFAEVKFHVNNLLDIGNTVVYWFIINFSS